MPDTTTAARPLPGYLAQRYHGWRATTYRENRSWYRRLAAEGQRPREMVITCCDSRIHVGAMFGSDSDDLFVHRNVAALVPEYKPDGHHHSTSASIEYAVTTLKVSHIIVLGHSSCGGVRSCLEMCLGDAPDLERQDNFVGRWLDILRPGYERLGTDLGPAEAASALERMAVLVSLENLMTFPIVRQAVDAGDVTLHGLWIDIGEGSLEAYDPERKRFIAF